METSFLIDCSEVQSGHCYGPDVCWVDICTFNKSHDNEYCQHNLQSRTARCADKERKKERIRKSNDKQILLTEKNKGLQNLKEKI
jgi:hypothetical protein